jgi:hypothetical protein
MDKGVKTLIANLAAEHRKRDRDPARIAELREQIRAQQIEDYVRRAVAIAPPLSGATRDRLAALLTDVIGGDRAA